MFEAIADALNLDRVLVEPQKLRILRCLDGDFYKTRLTTDPTLSQLHVLPIFSLSVPKLSEYLARHTRFTAVCAFKPTGWSFGGKNGMQESHGRGVTVYGQ